MSWLKKLFGTEPASSQTQSVESRSKITSPEKLLDFSSDEDLKAVRSDREKDNRIYLIKACSKLKATYQIRLLLFQAVSEGKILVLCVKRECLFSNDLRRLQKAYKENFDIEYAD